MKKYKILVADDETLVQEHLKEVLDGHALHPVLTLNDERKKF